MGYQDLTDPVAVLEAIIEFDDLERDAFLGKYGFAAAKSYLIDYDGKLYDTKPIVAAAHGYQLGEALPNNFSGGEATLVPILEGLGFDVTRPKAGTRLPTWSRYELILALEAYLTRRGWAGGARPLSRLSPGAWSCEVWRSSRTLFATALVFATLPESRSKSRISRRSTPRTNARAWRTARAAINTCGTSGHIVRTSFMRSPLQFDGVGRQGSAGAHRRGRRRGLSSAQEGRLLYRLHRRYERDPKLVKAKKDGVLKATGRLACEGCDFESSEVYGEGIEVIDLHHIKPLHSIDKSKTKLTGLALLCPTCHRVVHAHKPFVTPRSLREIRRHAATVPAQ